MPTTADAIAFRDPVNQIHDWNAVKERMEADWRRRGSGPPIAVYHWVCLQMRRLTLYLTSPHASDEATCSKVCDPEAGRIRHTHSPAKTFTLDSRQIAESVTRSLTTLDTQISGSAGGSYRGFKFEVGGERKTHDEIETYVRTLVEQAVSRGATFELDGSQQCAAECGTRTNRFGVFTRVTYVGDFEVWRRWRYEASTGRLIWEPDFDVRPSPNGEVTVAIDISVDWFPESFNPFDPFPCTPCEHGLMRDEAHDEKGHRVRLPGSGDETARLPDDREDGYTGTVVRVRPPLPPVKPEGPSVATEPTAEDAWKRKYEIWSDLDELREELDDETLEVRECVEAKSRVWRSRGFTKKCYLVDVDGKAVWGVMYNPDTGEYCDLHEAGESR